MEQVNQEKRQQVEKLENEAKEMEAKLTRADKSVWKQIDFVNEENKLFWI